MKRLLSASGFLCVFLLVAVLPALAQERETPPPTESGMGLVFRWLNFAIVFGAIAFVAVKWGGPYFRAKAEETAGKIAEGARAREAAEQQREEIRKKLAGLGDEVTRLRAAAKRDAEAEAKRVREMAKAESEKIERASQMEIEAARRAAHVELKALAARLAVERAETLLAKEMTPQAETALFRTFVAELERSVN
jgi:F0F1-type ATP synthase membrane subunit b/b'